MTVKGGCLCSGVPIKIRNSFSSLIFLVCLACPVQAAQPNLSDISGTWSGLDKTSVAMQLSSVVLTIEAGIDQTVQGTLESTVVPYDSNTEAVTTTDTISGEYSATTGILKFHRMKEGTRSGMDVLAVFDENATAMAIIHNAGKVNQAPFILYQGREVRASLLSLADLDPLSAAAKSASRESSQQQRSQKQDAKAQYQQDVKDLTAQISASIRARDKELTAELRAQMKALNKDYAARRASRLGLGGDSSDCPAHVLAWADEMDNNGASLARFYTYIELSNLFRPSVFVAHFDKPFVDLNAAELQELLMALQGPCSKGDSALARGGTKIPLGYVVRSRPGYGVTEAGLAGIALELIASWYERMSEPVFSAGSLEDLEMLDKQGAPFLRMLWPAEINAAQTRLSTGKQNRIEQRVSGQLESIAARLRAGESYAIGDLYRLSLTHFLRELEEPRAQKMRALLVEITDSGIAEHLELIRGRLKKIADPMARLIAGRAWYVEGGWALDNLADHSPSVAPFWSSLGADREDSYRDLQSKLLAKIDAIELRPVAVAFGYDFKIPLDELYSPSWRTIDAKRAALVRSMDYEAHVARVGEGPFGTDYTGAILLNAIYRNDLGQIADEDNRFHEALIKQTALVAESPLGQLAELLMGGSGTGAETMLLLEQGIRNTSTISPVLGFFMVSYERIYPECMDADAVPFSKTTYFETVVTNGWGAEVGRYPSGSYTQRWNINRRHVAVFEKLDGDTDTPASLHFFGKMWSNMIPDDIQESLQFLANTMRGLQKAMHENSCDSDLMKTLDANMLEIYTAKFL